MSQIWIPDRQIQFRVNLIQMGTAKTVAGQPTLIGWRVHLTRWPFFKYDSIRIVCSCNHELCCARCVEDGMVLRNARRDVGDG